MAVVGIDFGNLSLLIAQAAKGGVDVILNESSNRQTATFVSVQGKQRFIGDSGAAMVSSLLFFLSTSHSCFSLVPTWQTLFLW
jgi:molecular chaperone DnaK (HSP70)